MCFCVFFRGLYRVPGPTSAWTRFARSRCKGQAVFIWLGTISVHDRPVAPAYPMAGSRALHQVMRPVMGLGGGSRPHNPGGGCTPFASSSVRAGLDADPSQAVQLAFWVFWRHPASERQQLYTASFPAQSWERVTAISHCLAAFVVGVLLSGEGC